MFSSNGKLDYVNSTQEQLLVNIEKQVKELMRAEMPAAETARSPNVRVTAINKYNFPERSRQEEFEGIMVTFMNNQEKQIQQLETRMENTRSVFMDLADKFISRIKEKIREKAIPKKIKNIFELPIPNETSSDGHNETPLSVSST
jgi:hypothetical protein